LTGVAQGVANAYRYIMKFTLIIEKGERESRREFTSAAEVAKIAYNYVLEQTPVLIGCSDGRKLTLNEFHRALKDGDFDA
jgi:hypothetical protein